MNWAAMVAVALAIWGWAFPGAIPVVDQSDNPAYANVTSLAWADPWTQAPDCVVSILPRNMTYLTVPQVQNVITHEVGHCIGLEHISQPGIMYPDAGEFSGYDRAAFWRVHPAPHRVTIAMVGTE